jgi:hypothetical protein
MSQDFRDFLLQKLQEQAALLRGKAQLFPRFGGSRKSKVEALQPREGSPKALGFLVELGEKPYPNGTPYPLREPFPKPLSLLLGQKRLRLRNEEKPLLGKKRRGLQFLEKSFRSRRGIAKDQFPLRKGLEKFRF